MRGLGEAVHGQREKARSMCSSPSADEQDTGQHLQWPDLGLKQQRRRMQARWTSRKKLFGSLWKRVWARKTAVDAVVFLAEEAGRRRADQPKLELKLSSAMATLGIERLNWVAARVGEEEMERGSLGQGT